MIKQKIYKQILPTIAFIVMCLFTITLIVPVIWAIVTSFKSNLDFIRNPFGLPEKWHFENFITVFEKMYISLDMETGSRPVYLPELFMNSFLWSIANAFTTVFSRCVVAYVVAKYNFKLGHIIYATVIVTMILPIVGALPSSLTIMKATGVYDNFLGLAFIKISFTGSEFLFFYAAFKGISWNYAEAAFIDGAGHARVMFVIMIPLIMPTIFALGLLNFITHWNEWTATLIYIPSLPVAAYALYKFQNNTGNATSGVPFVMISCMWIILPVIILFVAFRNKLMGSITMGGLKG